jgi:hypothetical protein
MNTSTFRILLWLLAVGFAAAFCVIVGPPLLAQPDVVGAFAAGFVNPYASGYALDAIMSWCVLALWVAYEAKTAGIRHGWVALLLGVVPGVATGFAVYLLMRLRQGAARS